MPHKRQNTLSTKGGALPYPKKYRSKGEQLPIDVLLGDRNLIEAIRYGQEPSSDEWTSDLTVGVTTFENYSSLVV